MNRRPACVALAVLALFAGTREARAESKLLFDLGYRTAELDWSIAGNASGENPDVVSELTYEDLEIVELRAAWEITLARRWVLGVRSAFGTIIDGDNRDSDYAGDGRTQEWSRSNNRVEGDDLLDAAIAAGYAFRPGQERQVRIVPQIGFSYGEQNLNITDGFQSFADDEIAALFDFDPPPLGPFAGLDSSYEESWIGPWVGAEVELPLGEHFGLTGRAAYHWADYHAEADWNLRDDFEHPKSFELDADATGIAASLACQRRLLRASRIRLQLDYEDWSTDPGVARFFLADGTRPGTRLNQVNWESFAFSVGFDLLQDAPRYSTPPPEPTASPD